MSRIKSKNTKPEIFVRKHLYSYNVRYSLKNKLLPCNPDIILSKIKTVIFINGCFWHGHDNCKRSQLPKSNIRYWSDKIQKNKKRDSKNLVKIEKIEWKHLVLWECELNKLSENIQIKKLISDYVTT